MKVYIRQKLIGKMFQESPDLHPNLWTFSIGNINVVDTLRSHLNRLIDFYGEYRLEEDDVSKED